jgi:ADP-ribose pyrophosphatase
METETVLSSRRIYDGRIVHLRVDDVRTPTGFETRREIIEHSGAVALVAIDDEGRVLLVQQYRHAARRTTLEIPAGTLEAHEDPAACAVRELAEETGYSAQHLESIGGFYPSPSYCTEYIHVFVATGLTRGKARPEIDEHIEIESVAWAEALRRIETGAIDDAKSIAALLRVDARRRAAAQRP